MGRVDEALRNFYGAIKAARASGLEGLRITALTNLGGYHQDLYNLEDARNYSEEALRAARQAWAPVSIVTAAVNPIVTYHAARLVNEARAMGGYLLAHEDELLPGARQRYTFPLALAHLGVGGIDQARRFLERGASSAVGDGVTMWGWLQARCLLAA